MRAIIKLLLSSMAAGMLALSINYQAMAQTTEASSIDDNRLLAIIKSSDKLTLQSLLADSNQGLTVNSADSKGRKLLRLAVEYKQLAMVKYLLAQGVDINQQSKDGQTALHVAAYSNDIRLVNFLLAQGADANIQNHYGETPLYSAAFYGYSAIALVMLKNGGKLNIKNKEGNLPLTHAPAQLVANINQYLGKAPSRKTNDNAEKKSTADSETASSANSTQEQADAEGNQLAVNISEEAQANNLVDKIFNLSVEHQFWQQQHFTDNKDWIARISTGKKKELQKLREILTASGVTLLGDDKANFAFNIRVGRGEILSPSPLASFIPAFENLEQNNLLVDLANKRANVALSNYLDLSDWQIEQEGEDSLNERQANKLKKLRAKNIETIQAVFFYDALALMLEQFRLNNIKHDLITQSLIIELQFYHQSFSQTLVTENISEQDAQSWIENSSDIEWDIIYTIDATGIKAADIIFRKDDEILQASIL